MTVNVLPEPTKVATLLRELTASWIECVQDGDLLAVDTPFVLQDGHLFRAFISAGDRPGQMVVSDGGWASEQVELFARTVSVRNARIEELKRIGREAGIEWDTEFAYTATDLQSAVERMSDLARAVDRSLTLLHSRASRGLAPLAARLRDGLREAGLKVEGGARIELDGQRVRVDYRVVRNSSEAAVEILGGRSRQGAAQSIDHAVTNFHVLRRGLYPGLLVGVYDEDSPAAATELRDRFLAARPEETLLLPGSDAIATLADRLAA
jgi:hypothetical protein